MIEQQPERLNEVRGLRRKQIEDLVKAWNEQQEILGPDPWEYGLGERNARNFERLVSYSHEHGVIRRPTR